MRQKTIFVIFVFLFSVVIGCSSSPDSPDSPPKNTDQPATGPTTVNNRIGTGSDSSSQGEGVKLVATPQTALRFHLSFRWKEVQEFNSKYSKHQRLLDKNPSIGEIATCFSALRFILRVHSELGETEFRQLITNRFAGLEIPKLKAQFRELRELYRQAAVKEIVGAWRRGEYGESGDGEDNVRGLILGDGLTPQELGLTKEEVAKLRLE